jgi:cell division protein FtsW
MESTVSRKAAPKKKAGGSKKKDPNRIRLLDFSGRVDVPMMIITLVLLVFGMTMMFSAGHALSYRENDSDSYAYIKKQMIAAGIGLVLMFLASVFDYRLLRKEFRLPGSNRKFTIAGIILAVTMFVTALVIPFGVRNTDDGPKRWLKLPLFGTFQPSDFLKMGLIIFMAYYIHKNYEKMRQFRYGIFRPFLLFIAVAVLIMAQPHASCLAIIVLICGAMLYIGGMNWKPVIIVGIAMLGIGLLLIEISGYNYFYTRVLNTFDPLADTGDTTYQSYQAILAVGSGGFWGVGFGNSSQKYYYLPEAQNDFVYAVICEELGFIGGLAVIILFLIFVFRGFAIARRSEDRFGMMLATGITLQVGLQAFLNIGVNVCCVPNTGISMPFFSYGGTALMVQLAEVGLLLSVSKRAKLQ